VAKKAFQFADFSLKWFSWAQSWKDKKSEVEEKLNHIIQLFYRV